MDREAPLVPGRRQGHGHPQGVGRDPDRHRPRAARAVGRLGRPGGEQPHHDGGRALVHPGRPPDRHVARQPVRADDALRHPRARHGLDPQRHRAARRHPSLRRGAPGVFGPHPAPGAGGGAFLVFSDYMRPSVRLAALMEVPVTYVWTHDSIGLGEDGPTHQPVEHLWALRAIPGLEVIRPGDANETVVAWRTILERARPAALCLTRQNLPVLDRSAGGGLAAAEGAARGAYVLAEGTDVILIGTGSEVSLALDARDQLAAEGISARVVSMPCVEWFTA